MARTSAINWRDDDVREIARIRKNYNAKITRLEKKGIPSDMLPERITAKEIKEKAATRRDFNMIKKQAADFVKKGSEKVVEYKGQYIPEYEKKKITRMIQSVQQTKTAKRKKLSEEKGNTNLSKQTDLMALNTKKIRSPEDFDLFVKSLENQFSDKKALAAMQKYKAQYLKNAKDMLGQDAKELIDFLNGQAPDVLTDGYLEDALLNIDMFYEKINRKTLANSILKKWKEVIKSKK